MVWKMVRNSEPDFREDCFTGMCPRFGKKSIYNNKICGKCNV